MAAPVWRRVLVVSIASCGALVSLARAAPSTSPRPSVCQPWKSRLAELQRPGSRYLVGTAIIPDAVSAGRTKERAGELALTDLIQQISSRLRSESIVFESSGVEAKPRASLELTLRSRLTLRNYAKDDCHDEVKFEYNSLVYVEREALLRAAQAELAARNTDGKRALARAREAGDPLSALRDLTEAGRQLELAESEAEVVRGLGDAAGGQCFSTPGELEQLSQRARDAAPVRLVFPREMESLEAHVRSTLGGLKVQIVAERPFLELRGSFRGVSEPVRTAAGDLVIDAVVHVEITRAASGRAIDSVQVQGHDGDKSLAGALRRISDREKGEVSRQLREKLALAYAIPLDPGGPPVRTRSRRAGSGRARAAGGSRQ